MHAPLPLKENEKDNDAAPTLRPLFHELRTLLVSFYHRNSRPWLCSETQAELLKVASVLIRQYQSLLSTLEAVLIKVRNIRRGGDAHKRLCVHSHIFLHSEIPRCVVSATPDLMVVDFNIAFRQTLPVVQASTDRSRQVLSMRPLIPSSWNFTRIAFALVQNHFLEIDFVLSDVRHQMLLYPCSDYINIVLWYISMSSASKTMDFLCVFMFMLRLQVDRHKR